jgi:hypothetical protein
MDLERLGYEWANHQRQFFEVVLGTFLYHIYGAVDYEKMRRKLMAERGVNHLREHIACITPRQLGKTTMLAAIIAVMILNVPGFKFAICAQVSKTVQSILNDVARFINILGADKRVVIKNDGRIVVTTEEAQRKYTDRRLISNHRDNSSVIGISIKANSTYNFLSLRILGREIL